MHSIIHAKGSDIYAAFVHGAEEGYNRSTDNYVEYEKCLAKSFSFWLETTGTPKQIRAIKRLRPNPVRSENQHPRNQRTRPRRRLRQSAPKRLVRLSCVRLRLF